MKTNTINATYGRSKNKCSLFIMENANGTTWYCVKGGTIVNLTNEPIGSGCDIKELYDVDCFTVSKPINTEMQFIKAIQS